VRRKSLYLASGLIPLVVGCRDAGLATASHSVRDSAGIQLVESKEPSWREGEGWSVDSIPDLDLSGRDDEGLGRIGSPLLLDDGRLVFFNGGNCEVRFYSASGQFQSATGRCGEGPGEFQEFAALWPWRPDSILVIDRLIRVTVLGSDGGIGQVTRLPSTEGMPIPLIRAVFDDRTLIAAGPPELGPPPGPDVATDTISLGMLGGLEDTVRFLGTYPGTTWEYSEMNGRIARSRLAFSSATCFAAGASRLFVGFPDRYEINVYNASGTLERIIRRAFEPVPVEQRDVDWLMERRLREVEGADNQRAVRQAFRNLRYAEHMPGFGPPTWPGGAEGGPPMLVDTEGNLWVFIHYRPGGYRNDWSVFSSTGVWLGTVTLPDRLVPAEIKGNHLIGKWTDELGFEHVRRHRVIRP